ncbi:MAG TPA: MgtC/SapB family protein [Povalibacter sp.]|jgi:putative Mg2+ transporter-C (MgtC) family protein
MPLDAPSLAIAVAFLKTLTRVFRSRQRRHTGGWPEWREQDWPDRHAGTGAGNPAFPRRYARLESMNPLDWLAGESTIIAPLDALLRLLVAVLFGAVVGFDRELRNKPAGLRTHILISLAAALFTLITFELHGEIAARGNQTNADPIRIIEAVTAGVAFLAAGAIIQSRGNVLGLTTGANMWLAGALGVASGAGYYMLATAGAVLALIVLTVLGALESRLTARQQPKSEGPQDRSDTRR